MLLASIELTIVAGVTSHLGFFIRGEHHVQAPTLFRIYLGVSGLLFLTQLESNEVGRSQMAQAVGRTLIVIATYGCSLFTSMIIYRLLFHRLSGFPGPFMARVSKFWHVSKVLDARNYQVLEKLHHEYGDFVRTGPNEISIFRPEAVPALDGPGTRCTKAAWYDLLIPRVSVATTRDKVMHDQRRKIWDHGFSVQALQAYESRLLEYAQQLDNQIGSSAGNPINVSDWLYYYSFDVMGDLAFGKSFDMLKDGKSHFAIDMLRAGMTFLGPFSPVPWFVRVGYSIPWVILSWKRLLIWSGKQMKERIDCNTEKRDIASWLIAASKKNNSLDQDTHWLAGDAFAIVIAGSDTVGSTLTFLFYRLAVDSAQAAKLRSELAKVPSMSDLKGLRSVAHLDAVINETLRLHPPLPSGGLRETPPEGITIGGKYIPGNVVVSAPRYILGRLESCYEHAEEFIPERWYSEPHLIKDRTGFAPFSMGRYNCIGKNLALTQMRNVVALIVSKYDIKLAPGEDGDAVWKDMKDQFNAHPGKLELVFTPGVTA